MNKNAFSISKGADESKGKKVLIYGKEGVGKTILASHFPEPLFIDIEGSTYPYDHIQRLDPPPQTWEELQEAINWVAAVKPCQTLVIDALDKAEEMELRYLVKEAMKRDVDPKQVNLATLYGGYGKAFVVSEANIRTMLCQLEDITKLGMNVVVICHSQSKAETIPGEVEKIDHYELKLGNGTGSKTSAAVKEWADLMIFCEYKTTIMTQTSGKSTRAVAKGGEERIMHCNHTARFDAKNRYGLGNDLPLDYEQIRAVFEPNSQKEAKNSKQEELNFGGAVSKTSAQPIQPDKEDLPSSQSWESPLVPSEVSKLVSGAGYSENDLRQVLLMNGYVDDPDFNWSIVPADFWKQVVEQWNDFKQLLNNLPF